MNLITDLLNERNRRTCGNIFRTNALEPLEWREVRSLFSELGELKWQSNGDLQVTCNGHVLMLRPSRSKDVENLEERIELRRFLEQMETPRSVRELTDASVRS